MSGTILILLGWQLCTRIHIPSFWVLSLDTAASMVPVQEPETPQISAARHCQALPRWEENQLLMWIFGNSSLCHLSSTRHNFRISLKKKKSWVQRYNIHVQIKHCQEFWGSSLAADWVTCPHRSKMPQKELETHGISQPSKCFAKWVPYLHILTVCSDI